MRVMYDSVSVGEIPADARAVALYIDGNFANWNQRGRFHHANKISMTVWGDRGAQLCDCEPGNINAEATALWVRDKLHANPSERPIIYGSRDETADARGTYGIPAILRELAKFGIHRDQVRVGAAHYGQGPHICSPRSCGASFTADGTQHTNHALGRNLDEWLLADDFLAPPHKRRRLPRPRRPARPHPKTAAAAGAGALLTAIIAVLHAAGVHITPAESSAAAALAALIAAAIAPKTT